mmetsp:Transcript_10262/g.25548  ORF Transcript_10262/g.25548 Transcript_10262/m.25548 type:complete len:222 (-) Transcript_10262:262-927(-)
MLWQLLRAVALDHKRVFPHHVLQPRQVRDHRFSREVRVLVQVEVDLKVVAPRVKGVLGASEDGLLVVRHQQLVLGGRQRPLLRPLLNVDHARQQLQPLPSGAAVQLPAVGYEPLECAKRLGQCGRVAVHAVTDAEVEKNGDTRAVHLPKQGGLVHGELQVEDEQGGQGGVPKLYRRRRVRQLHHARHVARLLLGGGGEDVSGHQLVDGLRCLHLDLGFHVV